MWGARRRLSAAELSLLVMLESVFGPLWGWLCLGQRPSWQTVAAGVVILSSVALHTVAADSDPAAPAPGAIEPQQEGNA